jgi:hypothetical protein
MNKATFPAGCFRGVEEFRVKGVQRTTSFASLRLCGVSVTKCAPQHHIVRAESFD